MEADHVTQGHRSIRAGQEAEKRGDVYVNDFIVVWREAVGMTG